MFCEKCGKELNDEWKVCPNCGYQINRKELDTKQSDFESADSQSQERQSVSEVEKSVKVRSLGWLLLKIFALIALVCFFCPLFMVSCSGQELISLNGLDLTFGFQYMDSDIDGNLMFGFLGILPLLALGFSFVNDRKILASEKVDSLKIRSYGSAVAFGTLFLFTNFITAELQKNAEGTALEISSCTALRIMRIVAVLSVLIGGALAYTYEMVSNKSEKKIAGLGLLKCCGKIFVGSLILTVVFCLPFTLQRDLRPDTSSESAIKDYKPVGPEGANTKAEPKEDVKEVVPDTREEVEEEYIFPDSDKSYLSEDEVRMVDVNDLLLARNEIFARHGYIFNDPELKEYFESTSWYKGTVPSDQFNGDAVFNDFEKKNVELIKKIENEVNGVPAEFIGDIGSYVTDTQFQNAPMSSGVICIDQIDRNANTVEMRVGYPDMPNVLSTTGTIIDEKTVTADCQMFKITMTWNGDGTVTVEQYDTLEGTYTDAALTDYIKGTFHYIGRQGTQSY